MIAQTHYIKRGTLALDLGTTTGWAFDCPAVQCLGGRMDFTPKRGAHKGARYSRYDVWLQALLDDLRPSEIVYEHIGWASSAVVAHVYGGLLGVLSKCAYDRNIPMRSYTPKEIKKAATGAGTADKADMIQACRERLHVEPADDNEADARWLLWLANEKAV